MVFLTTNTAPGYTWGGNTWYRDPAAPAWRYQEAPYTFAAWRTATGLGASDQTSSVGPSGQMVFVQANRYESGRAHVVGYLYNRSIRDATNVWLRVEQLTVDGAVRWSSGTIGAARSEQKVG